MTDVLHDIVGNLQEIFRSEFRLAKAEIQQEVAKAARSGAPLVIGALLSLYGIGFLLLAVVHALSTVVDPWLAALLIGVAALAVSMVLISVGRNRLRQVRVVPERTVGTLKENVQWAKNKMS
jgi:uncharacterized membrane protein SirB2